MTSQILTNSVLIDKSHGHQLLTNCQEGPKQEDKKNPFSKFSFQDSLQLLLFGGVIVIVVKSESFD